MRNEVYKNQINLLDSAARTATNTKEFSTTSMGGIFFIQCTLDAAAASVVFKVDGVNPVDGGTYNIITSAAVASVSTVVLKVHPGITAAANVAVADILPSVMLLTATHADADAITYSVTFVGVN